MDMDDDAEYDHYSNGGQSWITWFCSQPGHEYYCEVAEDYIEDSFNLAGLSDRCTLYKEALSMILDVEMEGDDSMVPDVTLVEPYAEALYGMIHQRYICTVAGLEQMLPKYLKGDFGTCPRVLCDDYLLLPCGQHDEPQRSAVRLYCPNCRDIYVCPPKWRSLDGAHFGTTFAHLFVQTFPDKLAPREPAVYEPKIYGFRIHDFTPTGARMRWLRMTPPTA